MNLERNKRIAAFRKVSGYFIWLSMPLLVFVYFLGLMTMIGLLSVDSGKADIDQLIRIMAENPSDLPALIKSGVTAGARIFLIILLSFFVSTFIYILTHVQKLIKCFREGDIFNARALTHARKAYQMNLLSGAIFVFIELLFCTYCLTYLPLDKSDQVISFLGNTLYFLVEIGVLSLILWALEIGTDLNEEAELTI